MIIDQKSQIDDDDDLIIEVEDDPDFQLPAADEDIAEATPGGVKAPTTPDEDDNDFDDEGLAAATSRARKPQDDDDDDGAPDPDARYMTLEREKREMQATAILDRAELQAQHYEYQRSATAIHLQTVDDRIESAYQQLAIAEDNGDTASKLQISRAIQNMQSLRAQIEAGRSQIPDPAAVINHARQQARQIIETPQGKPVGAGIQARNEMAANWASRNSWMRDNVAANQFVISQSESMVKEGWSPDKRGFYAELSRRVKGQFPSLNVNAPQARKGTVQAKRGVVAPSRPSNGDMRSNTQRARSDARTFTLTAVEKAKMRQFKFDPNNKDHQKAWAKSRIESQKRMAAGN